MEDMDHMEIPFTRWSPAINHRISRRRYDALKPLPPDILTAMQKVCDEFRPFGSVRTALLTDGFDRVFTGLVGSYGKISGARAVAVFIGNTEDSNVNEKAGYTGEGVILEATVLGLGTCWIAGTYNPGVTGSLVKLDKNEKVFAVTPIGYPLPSKTLAEKVMTGFVRSRTRKSLSSMVSGMDKRYHQPWVNDIITAAGKAPSAANRQPWHFNIGDDSISVSIGTTGPDHNISKRLDCGIAMLHLEVAALNAGIQGQWEFLKNPLVARFKVSKPLLMK